MQHLGAIARLATASVRSCVTLHDQRALPAATVGALGLADITLGVVAPRFAPTTFWPHAALGATGTAIACGLALLLLARGLTRGLRAAGVANVMGTRNL
jgi:hypothetical protein